jgi:hypothetical protein
MSVAVEITIDSSEIDPFVAKMRRLIESVRAVFGEEANLEFEIDADLTPRSGELVLRPFCKSLEVRR